MGKKKLLALLLSTAMILQPMTYVGATETTVDLEQNGSNVQTVSYAYSELSDAVNGVQLKVEWNEPVIGEPMTFHVSGSGGSGAYKFRMDAPSYSNPNELKYESVADPSRGEWMDYTAECASYDYTFTMNASGTYNYRFYIMDTSSKVYLLRVSVYITVSDEKYPSV